MGSALVSLKCDPLLSGSLRAEPGFFPAYHMSKEHWISVELAAVDDDKLRFLIDMSWELTS
ncbi:MAG: MmcQ/YjbR family DNA-binding protein [Firmicutes bacterium]|nr:MmcQ/YjbR family DNA-binding protein [Bacillota bacterium]